MPSWANSVFDTPPREVTATGFWVNCSGHDVGNRTYQNPGRTLADHVLILTIDGEGWYRVADRRGTVTTGDLVLLPAGVEHGHGSTESGLWDIVYAHIAGPGVATMLTWWPDFERGRYAIGCPIEETSRLLLTAFAELRERRDAYGLAAAGYVQQAMRRAIVDARRGAPTPTSRDSTVLVVQQFIDERLAESLTLDEIAAHVHLAPSYLCRIFKRATGYSPMEYAITQRINRAKDLLCGGDLAVSAIARQSGYADAGYFARTFRAHTGMSPSTYRQMSLAGQANR